MRNCRLRFFQRTSLSSFPSRFIVVNLARINEKSRPASPFHSLALFQRRRPFFFAPELYSRWKKKRKRKRREREKEETRDEFSKQRAIISPFLVNRDFVPGDLFRNRLLAVVLAIVDRDNRAERALVRHPAEIFRFLLVEALGTRP